jgi:competence protein ComEC
MSVRIIKASIVFIIALIMFVVVQAAVKNNVYFPVIIYQLTSTFTPTITGTPYTPTPTGTVTPTRTITPTPTQTLIPGFHILHIEHSPDFDELDEYVTIKNATGDPVEMEGWTLKNDHTPPDIYTFPEFNLKSGKTVKVWTKWGENSSTDLYWGSDEPVWNDGGDRAYLRDSDNEFIAGYTYGD